MVVSAGPNGCAVWAGRSIVMTSDDQCGEKLDGVQCQLRIGHYPEVHVAGRRDAPSRRSWLLGRAHETSVSDTDLQWADGFPQP
jgi:hypothetical protein